MTAEKAERQDAAKTVSEKEKEMDVEEVFQFMNRESLAMLATVATASRSDGIRCDPRTRDYLRYGKDFAQIPELKEESAGRADHRLHNGSDSPA